MASASSFSSDITNITEQGKGFCVHYISDQFLKLSNKVSFVFSYVLDIIFYMEKVRLNILNTELVLTIKSVLRNILKF